MEMTYEALAKRIDHSLLPPMLTDAQLAEGCRLAVRYQVASVCIKPYAVPLAAAILQGTGVLVGTTVGFPHGGHHTAVKVFEAERAMDEGATELDMVVNIGQACWQRMGQRPRGHPAMSKPPIGGRDRQGDLRELLSHGRAKGETLPDLW